MEHSAALRAYSQKFYSSTDFSKGNVVASPLGSWLLAASVASGFDYTADPELKALTEKALGMSVEELCEVVRSITEKNPALNYVAKAWTSPDRGETPALDTWVGSNELIPVAEYLPSKEELDKWASENSNDLIKKFPLDPDSATLLIIANLIYSKLTWLTRFKVAPALGSMSVWGVENVLFGDATDTLSFYQDDDGSVFAVYTVLADSKHNERLKLVTCLSGEVSPQSLLDVPERLGSLKSLSPAEAVELSNGAFRVKEIRKGATPTRIEVNVPAWEVESEHDLLAVLPGNSLGYSELLSAFKGGSSASGISMDAKQVAVARFDSEGFEAAALTTMMIGRAAAFVTGTQTVYEMDFCKPFAFVSYMRDLPVFSGFIQTAVEAK